MIKAPAANAVGVFSLRKEKQRFEIEALFLYLKAN